MATQCVRVILKKTCGFGPFVRPPQPTPYRLQVWRWNWLWEYGISISTLQDIWNLWSVECKRAHGEKNMIWAGIFDGKCLQVHVCCGCGWCCLSVDAIFFFAIFAIPNHALPALTTHYSAPNHACHNNFALQLQRTFKNGLCRRTASTIGPYAVHICCD